MPREIRILLVDDDRAKLARLVLALDAAGVPREFVHVSQSVMEAKALLRVHTYDVWVLDLALPNRPEDRPDPRGGISLLDEVAEKEEYRKPRYIIGVTGYENLHRQLGERFADRLWTLLYADPSGDAWLRRISLLIDYLRQSLAKNVEDAYLSDVVVVTALVDPELKAVLRLPWNWSNPTILDPATYVYEGQTTCSGVRVSVVAAASDRAGMVPTSILATKLIERYRPKIVAILGICAGVRGRCEIGDVIAATTAWDWQSGKYVTDEMGGKFLIEPHQISVPAHAIARFVQIQNDPAAMSKISSDWLADKPRNSARLHIGPLVSGSSVLADDERMKEILEQHRKIVGVEMEAYGLLAAAILGPYPHPTALAIKAVSDFGDTVKDDRYRSFAAHNSANLFKHYIERYFQELAPLSGTM